MYFNRLLVLLLLLPVLFASCNLDDKPYPDEDLIYKYIQDNDTLFIDENDYYLLFLKKPRLTCVKGVIDYQADPLIRKHLDTAGNIPLFVVSNNKMLKKWTTFVYNADKRPVVLVEKLKTLESYGIPYNPLLFRIKNGKISQWRYVKDNKEIKNPDES